MEFSWEEYQKAKNIVSIFEKERKEIQSKRFKLKNLNWDNTINDRIWFLRNELSDLMYLVKDKKKYKTPESSLEFLEDQIIENGLNLLEFRKKTLKKINNKYF